MTKAWHGFGDRKGRGTALLSTRSAIAESMSSLYYASNPLTVSSSCRPWNMQRASFVGEQLDADWR